MPPISTTHYTLSEWVVFIGVAIFLLVVNAFFAASETSLLSVRDSRISQLVEEGVGRARAVERLRDRPERTLVAIQIIVTLVTTLSASLATSLTIHILEPIAGEAAAIAVASVFVLFFLSLFGEITPKNWAVTHAEQFALRAAPTVEIAIKYVIFPLVVLLETLSNIIIRSLGGTSPPPNSYPTEQEIKLIVEEGARFGELEEEEKEMIHKVMEIPGITAREIMTPRTQIVGADISVPISEIVELVIQEGHTRIPIYRGTVDDIIGILHAKDLLRVLKESPSPSVEQLMKQPLQIPESKKVDKLLSEFKQSKSQMAVVLDEYGGTAGLVTMEDVLEEIVGPITDEYDEPEEHEIETIKHGDYMVAGSAGLEDICEALDLVVNEEDAEGNDTIGGLVFGLLGRVPEVGDSIEYAGWRMVVDSVESRRVDRIHITRLPSAEGEDSPRDAASPV